MMEIKEISSCRGKRISAYFCDFCVTKKNISICVRKTSAYLTLLYRYRASDFQFPFGPSTSVLRFAQAQAELRFLRDLKHNLREKNFCDTDGTIADNQKKL